MWYLRRGLLFTLALALVFVPFVPETGAQQSGTPTAGTPIASGDDLAGRLGGSLDSITERFGPPDFTAEGVIRFDSVDLNGIPTILVVYADDSGTITRLALVYLVEPAALGEPLGILATTAMVAPRDGTCDATGISSGFGSQIYPCHSTALAGVFTAGWLAELGVTQGDPGSYSIAVDPLPDAYFELVIQPGADGATLAPAPTPGTDTDEPAATPVSDPTSHYPPLTDPAALTNGDIALNDSLSFTGEIVTLQIAGAGKEFRLGEDRSLGASALFQVRISGTNAANESVLFVGYDGDASVLAIGDTITVFGIDYGTQCFDNALGTEICQPLIAADIVEKPES